MQNFKTMFFTFLAAGAVFGGAGTAYAQESGTAAVLDDHPSGVLHAPLGDDQPGGAGAKVLSYPFENVARIAVGGQRGYVISNTPLVIDGQPLDLALESSAGRLQPAASPVALSISRESGNFTLKAPDGPAIKVTRLWQDGATGAQVVNGRLVLDGAPGDASSVIQATPTGVETFEVLRSADSPTSIGWRLDLPQGWMLRQATTTTVQILDRDGQARFVVSAPWAQDAGGSPVDLSLEVSAPDTISVTAHLAPDTEFPVVVDPDWATTYNFAAGDGAAGWFQINEPVPTNPALGYTSGFTGLGMAGLWIWPQGSMTGQYVNVGGDGEEVRGGLRFEAPGTTRIKNVSFKQTTWELRQEQCSDHTYRDVDQYLRFVLRDNVADITTAVTQIGGAAGLNDNRNVINPTTINLTDPVQGNPSSTSASVTMWTEAQATASPKTIFPNPRPASANCDDAVSPFLNVGRVDLTLTDTDAPTVEEVSGQLRDWASQAATAWIGTDPGQDQTATGTVRVRDRGAGIQLRGQDEDPQHPDPLPILRATNQLSRSVGFDLSGGRSCDPQHTDPAMEGRICPETVTSQFTDAAPLDLGELAGSSVPEGERDGPWDLSVTAHDLVGHATTYAPGSAWRYFVDTTAPTVSAPTISDDTGQSVAGRWIRATSADAARVLRASAAAADPVAGGVASGVRQVGLTWADPDGNTVDLVPFAELLCSDAVVASRPISGPCPTSQTTDVVELPRHLAEGKHTAEAQARDFARNTTASPASTSTWVDNTAPTVSLSGPAADLDGAWIAPNESARLEVSAEDGGSHTSGMRRLSVALTGPGGTALEPESDVAQCTTQPEDSGAPVPPAALCAPSASGTIDLDTASWPSGRVELTATGHDVAGNQTPHADPDIVVHVDRTAPTVRMTGEIDDLAGNGWVNPDASIGATLTATDEGAGIERLEIWAKDETGSRRVASKTVCTPPSSSTGDEPPCPITVAENFEIDPSVVGDGTATFEARAIEYVGRIARDRATLHLDDTPPPPVTGLRIQRINGTAIASWNRPAVPADSAPITGYVYAYVPAGQTIVTWTETPSTSVRLPELSSEIAAELTVCAVDETGRRSDCRTTASLAAAEATKARSCVRVRSADIAAMVAYAKRYWAGANPREPYFNNEKKGTSDCANFVSQILAAGDGSAKAGILSAHNELGEGDVRAWYNQSRPNETCYKPVWCDPKSVDNKTSHKMSTSWYNVDQLAKHFTTGSNRARLYTTAQLPPKRWRAGDLVLMNVTSASPSDGYSHVAFVVRGDSTGGNPGLASHTRHFFDKRWDPHPARHGRNASETGPEFDGQWVHVRSRLQGSGGGNVRILRILCRNTLK